MKYNRNNAIKDFVIRTKYNLDLYLENNKTDKEKYPYEVTQILNSFLGIIVLPQQKENDILTAIDISSLEQKMLTDENKTSKTLFRHLRNSVSHGNFLNDTDTDPITREIKQITFKDGNFKIVLSLEDICILIEKVATAVATTN